MSAAVSVRDSVATIGRLRTPVRPEPRQISVGLRGRSALSLTAILLALCATAAFPEERVEAPLEDPPPLYVSPTSRDRIGRILAPVMINGQGPFRFVVDTGATHSVMAAHLVRRLGLAPTAGSVVLLNGVTGSALVGTVKVERLQVGDLIMQDRHMAVINARLADEDGVLGADGLQDKKIVVDFSRSRIQILQSRAARFPKEFVRMPMRLDFKGLVLVSARIGRTPVKAIIDTGAERTLGNFALQQALKIGGSLRNMQPTTGVQGVTAQIQPAYLLTAPPIKLGDMYVTQVDISFGDIHVFKVWNLESEPAVVVGMDVLGILDAVIIDYGRNQLLLKPRPMQLRLEMLK